MEIDRFLKSSRSIWENFNSINRFEFEGFPHLKIDTEEIPKLWGIDGWIRDINYSISETEFCLHYAKIYDNELQNGGYGLLEFHRNLYIKTVLNNLFSIGDKISILFCDLMGIETLKHKIKDRYKTFNLKELDKKLNGNNPIEFNEIKNNDILTEEDFNNIKIYICELFKIKDKKLSDFRNANTHRWNVGIDSYGAGILKIKYHKGINNNEKIKLDKNTESDKPYRKIKEIFKNSKGAYMTIKLVDDNITFIELVKKVEDVIVEINKINRGLCDISVF